MSTIPFSIAIGIGKLGDEERSDYQAVPDTDAGTYRDRGMLGSYSTSEVPFEPSADIRFETGFGADEADLRRGYCEPLVTEHPAYALENYKNRSSQPMEPDVTPGNLEPLESDMEFRSRNRKSRGFLTRPHIPTERN